MKRCALGLILLIVLSLGCGDDDTVKVDTIPPATVSDLKAEAVTSTSVTLTWTAPGDNGDQGTAAAYDVRYNSVPITDVTWGQSTQVADVPPPNAAAAQETLAVTGLQPGHSYHFALKTAEEIPNWSEISNVAGVSTLPNSTPRACFLLSPIAGTASTVFNFDASCSSDADDSLSTLTFSWDWEDDGVYDEESLGIRGSHHQYGKVGSYEVALKVEDRWGSSDITLVQIEVMEGDFILFPDGTGDAESIQSAVDAAEDGDLIRLWPGVFKGMGNRSVDYLGKAVEIRSLNGIPGECIIDCRGRGSAFVFQSGEPPEAILADVTIANALSDEDGGGITCVNSNPTLVNCIFTHNQATEDGGGIFCLDSNPTISDCEFIDNIAGAWGGGLHCLDSSPTLTDCSFSDNKAFAGGGMSCEGSLLTLTGCDFTGNSASSHGGGMASIASEPSVTSCTFSDNSAPNGGGIDFSNSGPVVSHCVFRENSADEGGAVYCLGAFPEFADCIFELNVAVNGAGVRSATHQHEFSRVKFVECTLADNEAEEWGGGIAATSEIVAEACLMSGNSADKGGALYLGIEGFHIQDCTLVDNSAASRGGGVNCSEADAEFVGCTISNNAAGEAGGGMSLEDSSRLLVSRSIISFSLNGEGIHCEATSTAGLICCDVYDNEGGDWIGCIEDQLGVDGNISSDPLFCDPDMENFELQEESPCTPDSSGCGLIGAWGTGCD